MKDSYKVFNAIVSGCKIPGGKYITNMDNEKPPFQLIWKFVKDPVNTCVGDFKTIVGIKKVKRDNQDGKNIFLIYNKWNIKE